MSLLRKLILIALLPGLILPAGVGIRFCFCAVFGEGTCGKPQMTARVAPQQKKSDCCAHRASRQPKRIDTSRTEDRSSCFCLNLKTPEQPQASLKAPSVSDDLISFINAGEPPQFQVQPIDLGSVRPVGMARNRPPPWTRTLPLLI